MLKSKQSKVPDHVRGDRLDLVACELFPDLSRKKIKSILDAGGAYVNKKRVYLAKYEVYAGDKIELFWNEGALRGVNTISLQDIVYDNPEWLVVCKPAGLASQATLESQTNTLLGALNRLDSQKFPLDKLFLVHRLDKDTSGLILIAKTKAVQKEFEELFLKRQIEKKYEALCFYTPPEPQGLITYPIAKRQDKTNTYFAVLNLKKSPKDSKSAETYYTVLHSFTKSQVSHVLCEPKTGRTHQIRVHMSAMGCPVLGDKTYALNIIGHRLGQSVLRHMLHAKSLQFTLKGEKYAFESPLPQDFKDILSSLEKIDL
jgi:RluA family pseudouridine synthase